MATIMPHGRTGQYSRYASADPDPVPVDPSEPALVETLAVGPGAEALAPVLILPGIRVYVDLASTHTEAAIWWHNLGVAALMAAQQYDEETLRWGR